MWRLAERDRLIHLNVEGALPVDGTAGGDSPIPRVVHQVWFGKRPAYVERFRDGLREANPGWDFRLWDEATLPQADGYAAIADVMAALARFPLERSEREHRVLSSDLARIHLLATYGGVYLDSDMEAGSRPLAALEKHGRKAWAGVQGKQVKTGALGSVPNHPFMAEYLNIAQARIAEAIETSSDLHAVELAGPRLITALWKTTNGPRPDLLPQDWFYSYSWRDTPPTVPHADSIVVHHWASTREGW